MIKKHLKRTIYATDQIISHIEENPNTEKICEFHR